MGTQIIQTQSLSTQTRGKRFPSYTPEEYQRRAENMNAKVLTVKETAQLFGVRMETVRAAIASGRLIAVKKDAEEFQRGGFWLVEHSSAIDLWGHRL